MGKCVYCKKDIEDNRAVDICDSCGKGVWGGKMFKAIIDSMNNAREKGDLMQGSVNSDLQKRMNPDNNTGKLLEKKF